MQVYANELINNRYCNQFRKRRKMKKTLGPIFSFLLVMALVLGSFGTAIAAPGDDPVVTPVSGDTEFTTEVVPIAALPGTTPLASQMIVPVGFPAGEAQFGGNGIRVTGMDKGTATACFSLNAAAVQQGWGGKVGVWNGSKWVLLPTTITTAEESSTSLACAAITGSGTYAFIQYVTQPDKLPTMGECDFNVEMSLTGYVTVWGDGFMQGWVTGAMFSSERVLTGLPVSVRVLRTDPDGYFIMEGTGYGDLVQYGPGVYGTVFDDFLWYTEQDGDFYSATFYVTFGNCYKILDILPSET
jgi:hypothetical protein